MPRRETTLPVVPMNAVRPTVTRRVDRRLARESQRRLVAVAPHPIPRAAHTIAGKSSVFAASKAISDKPPDLGGSEFIRMRLFFRKKRAAPGGSPTPCRRAVAHALLVSGA